MDYDRIIRDAEKRRAVLAAEVEHLDALISSAKWLARSGSNPTAHAVANTTAGKVSPTIDTVRRHLRTASAGTGKQGWPGSVQRGG